MINLAHINEAARLSFISPESLDAESTKRYLSSHPLHAAGNAQYAPCTLSKIPCQATPCLPMCVLHIVVTSVLTALLGSSGACS